MPRRILLKNAFAICFALALAVPASSQQVGLSPDDVQDDIVVSVDGVNMAFTLLRDSRKPSQWYYVPNQPRLFEVMRAEDDKVVPEFSLIRYQFPNPADPAILDEGAIAQFSILLSPKPEAVTALRTALAERLNLGEDEIQLTSLPFTEGTVALYDQRDSLLIGGTPEGGGVAPTFASQKMSFQVPLTKAGADFYDTVTSGNTGVGVSATLTYQGLTPAAGFKATVNWKQLFEHLSKEEKIRAQISYGSFFGMSASASYEKSNTEIRENLTQSKSVKIDVIQGSGFDMAQIDKYLQPLLARINQELLDSSKPPERIDPASAHRPDAGGRGISGGYSVAMKKIELTKSGEETIEFNVRTIVDRKTTVEGFVGLTSYPEDVRKEAILFVKPGDWSSATFPLPTVAGAAAFQVASIDLEVTLQSAGQALEKQLVSWTQEGGWKKAGRQGTVDSVAFPLAAYMAKIGTKDLGALQFVLEYSLILADGRTLHSSETQQAVNGFARASQPLSAFERIEISPSALNWKGIDSGEVVSRLDAILRVDGEEFTANLQPKKVGGEIELPSSTFLLVPRQASTAIMSLQILDGDGKRRKWKSDNFELKSPDSQRVSVHVFAPNIRDFD
ncbi:hypothetical protein [Sinorhizobium meliloti]|uniref:hypothetical protein n=1 Tax=Rhizobium meliloti TaxID=382 RepID=UPI001297A7CA|nr:hypothetical protein [Sinorhizobium meliloti]MQU92894.1 hypothetical protein [Sinorhizobium meliloti]